ncbi:MAG: response regulator [Pseudobdellovibrionaceae bacterium]
MSNFDERILILTSTQKDSHSTSKLLTMTGLDPFICESFEHLLLNLAQGAGALLLAKEVLVDTNLGRLTQFLNHQDSWSELPVIILASAGDLVQGKAQTLQVLKTFRNITVLERPVRVATLTSILESSIANRKRQYEVRDLVKKLVEAQKVAEIAKEESDRANRTKSEFLANMSHEIRTPLGVILGFSDLALEETTTEEERKIYRSMIQRNGQMLLALINDVLDLSKVEAGQIETEDVETSIVDILQDVVTGFKSVAAAKDVIISLDVANPFPAKVMSDPNRIRQVFMNVIGNAVKFTRQGQISLKLWSTPIDEARSKIFLETTDTGLGISEQQQKKLFKPFSQADSSTTREFGGTGLGLVLSRQLATAMRGDFRLVKSVPGQGSTFEFSLEVNQVSVPEDIDFQLTLAKKNQDISGLRVLLVDDSSDNQLFISKILKMAGASVKTAKDGIEGVEKASNEQFDIVLMDLQMPRLDGNEATRRLRDQGYEKPIIALTANALKGDREKALESGFDGYITKPIQRNALFESLAKFL